MPSLFGAKSTGEGILKTQRTRPVCNRAVSPKRSPCVEEHSKSLDRVRSIAYPCTAHVSALLSAQSSFNCCPRSFPHPVGLLLRVLGFSDKVGRAGRIVTTKSRPGPVAWKLTTSVRYQVVTPCQDLERLYLIPGRSWCNGPWRRSVYLNLPLFFLLSQQPPFGRHSNLDR